MFGKKKKGSKILKLPPVRNCFTLAVTNKLVVIINSLKVPKIKTILLYEMKFLVRNYSCLQIPRLWGYRPQIPVLCPQLNLLNPPPNKIPGYATASSPKRPLSLRPFYENAAHATFSFGEEQTCSSRNLLPISSGKNKKQLTQLLYQPLHIYRFIKFTH